MKGPYERLKYDLRRLWECPACKRRERTAGSITFRHCTCRLKQLDGKPVVMQLVADDIQRLVPAVTIQHQPQEPTPREMSADHRDAAVGQVAGSELVPPADTHSG